MINLVCLIGWIKTPPLFTKTQKFIYFEIILYNQLAFFQSNSKSKTSIKIKSHRFIIKRLNLRKGDLVYLQGIIINDNFGNCVWSDILQRIS